jgi:hypothetical protein
MFWDGGSGPPYVMVKVKEAGEMPSVPLLDKGIPETLNAGSDWTP